MTQSCLHLETDLRVGPPLDVCTACVDIGSTWCIFASA